mgnify:FL=1
MSARDVIFIGITIFGLAIVMFIFHFAFGTITDSMVNVPAINETTQTVEVFQGINNFLNRLDYVVSAIFLGLILGLIVTGWVIGGNPIFMFFYFIFVVISVLISPIISNFWESFTNNATISASLSAFPIANNILLNLPIYMSVIGIIGLIVMFGKPYFQQNE